MRSSPAALSPFRVLDLSRILAGPWATQLLGDMGAEIIKIERPVTGDDTRQWGPPFFHDTEGNPTSLSAYFSSANRNKKSVTVDITQKEGQEIIKKLALQSDVFVENFKVGGLAAYGLDYASLSALNPKLIYCSITGFGQTGPYAKRAGYDFLIQAMGGLMSVTGEKDEKPMKAGVALADILTGLYASNAILASLHHRERTGVGQYIDMALMDVQIACLANQAMNYLTTGTPPTRLGNAHPNIVPYQDFKTKDGYLILAVGNDQQFAKLCETLETPLATNPLFATNAARVANRDQLIPLLEACFSARRTAEWVADLEAAQIPCGPINNVQEVFNDPHVQARGLERSMETTASGTIPFVANPIRMSETPVSYNAPPPAIGEHTEEVLKALIQADERIIEEWKKKGVI